MRTVPPATAIILVLAVAPWMASACGSSSGGSVFDKPPPVPDGGGGALSDATLGTPPSLGNTTGGPQPDVDASGPISVTPSGLQTITVTLGAPPPNLAFHPTVGGQPVTVGYSVDRGEIGSVDANGVFTPRGTTAGTVTITAAHGSQTVQFQVLVKIAATQNGATAGENTGADGGVGAGGRGGVGGEGVGGAVTDSTLLAALKAPPKANGAGQSLHWLYPYDGTVWPRGLLAPLLQWDWSLTTATGVAIHLETKSGSFVYDGVFAPPASLNGSPFIHHPIPQDIWDIATNSASGPETLTVRVSVASGTTVYGPLTQTWTVAPARLTGTVYYNSYLTHLVTNSEFNVNGEYFGAAILGIRAGKTDPYVVAGTTDPPGGRKGDGCRACHTVAANGSRLIAQHGPPSGGATNYQTTSAYDLTHGGAETVVDTPTYPGTFSWAALSPNGQLALTNAVPMAANDSTTHVYSFLPTGAAIATTGLPANLQAGTPAFSADGKHVAFTLHQGTLGSIATQDTQVVVMDVNGSAFSNPRAVFTMPAADVGKACVGFPSFLPTNDAVIVQYQLAPCGSARFGPYLGTGGVSSELWWADLAGAKQIRLAALNGKLGGGSVYLPSLHATQHDDDSILNYEPTVNPVVSGGYAWVIFTSRRLYGNVATVAPMLSDPRLGLNYHTQVTTKKLWVAAIDLNAAPGTDSSHPAFYLPAQELQAGNSRGYWVLDPCRSDGTSCDTGDECCGGFCQPAGDGGALVCANQPATSHCSATQEKCVSNLDCCLSTNSCVDGFCALPSPVR